MLAQKEFIINDVERFSDQLIRLQEALRKANAGAAAQPGLPQARADEKPVYKETGSPICSPASSAIN